MRAAPRPDTRHYRFVIYDVLNPFYEIIPTARNSASVLSRRMRINSHLQDAFSVQTACRQPAAARKTHHAPIAGQSLFPPFESSSEPFLWRECAGSGALLFRFQNVALLFPLPAISEIPLFPPFPKGEVIRHFSRRKRITHSLWDGPFSVCSTSSLCRRYSSPSGPSRGIPAGR